MQQLKGLWRDTKWLWIAFSIAALGLSFAMSPFFLILLPSLPICFGYFAFIRYDSEGNDKDRS